MIWRLLIFAVWAAIAVTMFNAPVQTWPARLGVQDELEQIAITLVGPSKPKPIGGTP